MKAFKKINRGVIIAVIALLCVSIYLISLSISQNAEKPAIENVVQSYLNTYVSYNMLPQNYRTATPDIPQSELDNYISKMESDIRSYFAPDDNSYKFMTDTLKNNLESQKTETTVVFNYSKSISQYSDFSFDNSTVTVTVDTNATYDGPDQSSGSAVRVQLNTPTKDKIVLKKVDGSWKVVYSNINRPTQKQSLGGGIVIRKSIG